MSVFNRSPSILKSGKLDMCNKQTEMLYSKAFRTGQHLWFSLVPISLHGLAFVSQGNCITAVITTPLYIKPFGEQEVLE